MTFLAYLSVRLISPEEERPLCDRYYRGVPCRKPPSMWDYEPEIWPVLIVLVVILALCVIVPLLVIAFPQRAEAINAAANIAGDALGATLLAIALQVRRRA
jgi:hypothetical protein